jgi:hypothetical protein
MKLRRDKILSQCSEWLHEAEAMGASVHRDNLEALLKKIKQQLEKLV